MRNISSTKSFPMIRRLVVTYLWPRRYMLAGAVFFMILAAGMTALFARLIQPVIDDVMIRAATDPSARSLILPMALSILGCFVVRGLASYGQSLQMARISQAIIAHIQNDLFRHLIRLDLGFFHKTPSGQLTSRVISDVNVMRAAVSDSLAGIGNSALTLVFLCGVMVYQDWHLAIIALGALPIASVMVMMLGRKLRTISKSLQDQTAYLMDRLSEIFKAIRQVQAYGMEAAEEGRADQAIHAVRRLNVKSVQVGEMITPINETLIGLTVFAVVVYGGVRIAEGATTAGALLSFIAAFSLAYEPMKKLGKLHNSLQMGLGAAERVFDLMDETASIKTTAAPDSFAVSSPPTIQFDHVTFSYPQAEQEALQDINLICPAGKVTALVGPSGGGKSTLINMILRFYDPLNGHVYINGQNIQNVDLRDLRASMALVSQDIHIFNASVRDNIAYGRVGSSIQDIENAARHAAAHAFILALPNGYDTVLGENGVLLSGGQRQRLAIARAMLRDAPILLLDEATSALDSESERAVQESLEKLEAGRTTIVIAHRLSTIRHAHQIVVVDDGHIVDSGSHDDLMARGGLYARLYSTFGKQT